MTENQKFALAAQKQKKHFTFASFGVVELSLAIIKVHVIYQKLFGGLLRLSYNFAFKV